jgi:hypothetical protein
LFLIYRFANIFDLDDSYNNRTALATADLDPEELLTAETGPCDLLVHYEDFSASWSELVISSDLGWEDFRRSLAEDLEIPTKNFKDSAIVTWIRGGASARGKGITMSDPGRWGEITKNLKAQKLKGKKNIDPTIPNIYIRVLNLKVKSPNSTLTN